MVSFWERLLIPPIGWLIRGSIDLDKSNNPSYIEAFANGQMILFRRSDYVALDGHSMVQSEVLEDVKLAQRVKQSGKSAEVRPVPWAFEVRLYRSLSEIVNGYTKACMKDWVEMRFWDLEQLCSYFWDRYSLMFCYLV